MDLRHLILVTVTSMYMLCSSLALAGVAPIRQEVSCVLKVNERYQSYDVDGTSCDQLRKQMRQHGTKWNDGDTYAAETSWDIRYGFDVSFADGRCSVKSVKTDVDIVYHLPHRVICQPDAELTVLWDDYLTHLKRHEFGHKDIAVKTAAEINEILASLGSFGSQRELEQEATRRTEEKFQRMKEAQIEYDNETGHGESQGAVLRAP